MTLRQVFRNECKRLVREESGVAVVFTLCSFLFLYACCASVWFVGENVRRKVELQDACDAAAYSASVVQADGLSRMATVNRAMSWCYVQMTKMQMDYVTLRWLELTKERFDHDRKNTARTGGYRPRDFVGGLMALGKMFGNKAAYWTLQDLWYAIGGKSIERAIPKNDFFCIQGGFSCKEHTHGEPDDSAGNGSYIGFRGMFQGDGDHIGCVRLNASRTRELDSDGEYFPVDGGGAGGGTIEGNSVSNMVEELQAVYDPKGSKLVPLVRAMKAAIVTCNALLPSINRQMGASIEKTAVRTLFENLPRNEDGVVDPKLLDRFRWTVMGGVSRPPREYSSGLGGYGDASATMCLASKPYFSGLHNTEEDEMVFLNMADGLPEVFGGGKTKEVRLVDYFADRSGSSYNLSASVKGLCSGLDQWFIRCDPDESAISDQVVVMRSFAKTPGGIVRAYKNANYDEGSSGAGIVADRLLGGFGSGIHRGNYVSELGDDARNAISGRVFSPLMGFANGKMKPSDWIKLNKPKKPRFPKLSYYRKKAKYEALKKIKGIVSNMFDAPVEALLKPFAELIKAAGNLSGNFLETLVTLDVEPSCKNDRYRFIDKCANTRDTTGLVAEWEWASAYWACNWLYVKIWTPFGTVCYDYCSHPFVPIAAIHGGVEGTDSYVKNWGGALGELWMTPFQWVFPEVAMFRGDKGKKRAGEIDENGYRSTFVSIDTDLPNSCTPWHEPVIGGAPQYNGRRSNYLLKGFSRVYGDDAAIYDDNYQGVPCQPWVLDESFFRGAGSIVVGVARKQSNFFADLFDEAARKADILRADSLYAAFTPADERQHFVALAASRAGWSPRSGTSRAEGTDSVNAGPHPARVFELRYDSVLDRKLGPFGHPELPDDIPGLSPEVARRLEETGRIGCVCGNHNTTARLRRQWNLSQTDWDGVLLPLRYAFASHSEWDSGKNPDALSDWTFDALGTKRDASATVAGLLWDHAAWRPFKTDELGRMDAGRGSAGESAMRTKDVLPLPVGLDGKTPADLVRKRRIL